MLQFVIAALALVGRRDWSQHGRHLDALSRPNDRKAGHVLRLLGRSEECHGLEAPRGPYDRGVWCRRLGHCAVTAPDLANFIESTLSCDQDRSANDS